MLFARLLLVEIVALALAVSATAALAAPTPAACTYVLGFQTLHDLIPDIVGPCTSDEFHNPDNGDGLQSSTNGLLVWRKADNWTAFTDGSTTWINGPFGLQSRPNEERFPWEGPATVHPAPVLVFFPRHPESDDDFSAVFPVNRAIDPEGGRVPVAAVEALIAGPTEEEQAQGYFSEFGASLSGSSTCGDKDFTLTVDGGLATLRLCRQYSSAGVGQDARVTAQVEQTLLPFPQIDQVRILASDGSCLFDASGQNQC